MKEKEEDEGRVSEEAMGYAMELMRKKAEQQQNSPVATTPKKVFIFSHCQPLIFSSFPHHSPSSFISLNLTFSVYSVAIQAGVKHKSGHHYAHPHLPFRHHPLPQKKEEEKKTQTIQFTPKTETQILPHPRARTTMQTQIRCQVMQLRIRIEIHQQQVSMQIKFCLGQ